jgi:hypothetical protein
MCTVTVVPLDDGFRLRCNRDERRDRPTATSPVLQTLGRRLAVFPVDPTSQGTWVGVNDVGLAIALLNRSGDCARSLDPEPRVSRGRIIPALLACASLDEALERCATLDPGSFGRFRLLMIESTTVAIVTSDTRVLSRERVSLSQPVMQTSSSLGDDVVEGPRRKLFDRLFDQDQSAWLHAQRQFHHHQWRARPEISVLMERADASTVSETVIDVRLQTIEVCYQATEFCTSRPASARPSIIEVAMAKSRGRA